jgi:hypothetical protein
MTSMQPIDDFDAAAIHFNLDAPDLACQQETITQRLGFCRSCITYAVSQWIYVL